MSDREIFVRNKFSIVNIAEDDYYNCYSILRVGCFPVKILRFQKTKAIPENFGRTF